MQKSVKLYSTPTCPYCIKTKQFLKDLGVDFVDFDVSEDSLAANEMVEKSGQMAVPVLDIDGNIIVGFDPEEIKRVLEL